MPMLLALIVGVVTFLIFNKRNLQVGIVVAKQPIPKGTVINDLSLPRDDFFAIKKVDPDKTPQTAFKSLDELYSNPRGQLMVVDTILKDDIPEMEKNVRPEVLPPSPNMMAVTVLTDQVSAVGGFLQPNDYVDVIATTRFNQDKSIQSRTILSKVRVLAVGFQSADTTGKTVNLDKAKRDSGPKVQVQPTATLEVFPEEARRLSLWEAVGKLRLAKLNPVDVPKKPSRDRMNVYLASGNVEQWTQPAKAETARVSESRVVEHKPSAAISRRPAISRTEVPPALPLPELGAIAPAPVSATYEVVVEQGSERKTVPVSIP